MNTFRDSIDIPTSIFMGDRLERIEHFNRGFDFYVGPTRVVRIDKDGITPNSGIIDSNVLFIDEAEGRVGINTSLPQYALDVSGDSNVSGDANILGNLYVSGDFADIRSDTIIEGDLSVSGNLVGLDCTCSSLILSGFVLAQEDINSGQQLVGNSLYITSGGIIAGDLTVSGTLNANIDVSFTGVVDNLTVSNNVTIGNQLIMANEPQAEINVNDNELFIRASTVFLDANPSGSNLEVLGDGVYYGDLTVSGTLNANIDVSFDGNVENLTVTNDVSIGNQLDVGGNSIFEGDLTVSGTLFANLDVSFDGVVENLTVSNNATIGNQLEVTGLSYFYNDMDISGDLLIRGDAGFIRMNVLDSSIVAEGPIQAAGISTDGRLEVVSNSDLSGSVFIGSTFNLTTLQVRCPATFNDNVTLSQSLEVDGDGLFIGDLSVSGNLYANIDVSFDGVVENLTVSNNATIGNQLDVSGDVSLVGANITVGRFNSDVEVRGLDLLMDVASDTTIDTTTFNLVASGEVSVEGDISTIIASDNQIDITSNGGDISIVPGTNNIVSVRGNSVFDNDVTVVGNLYANIDVSFDGIVENLTVSNNAFIGNQLSVDSISSNGALTIESTADNILLQTPTDVDIISGQAIAFSSSNGINLDTASLNITANTIAKIYGSANGLATGSDSLVTLGNYSRTTPQFLTLSGTTTTLSGTTMFISGDGLIEMTSGGLVEIASSEYIQTYSGATFGSAGSASTTDIIGDISIGDGGGGSGSLNVDVGGIVNIGGDQVNVGGVTTFLSANVANYIIAPAITMSAFGSGINMRSTNTIDVNAGGDLLVSGNTIDMSSGGTIDMSSGGAIDIVGGGQINITSETNSLFLASTGVMDIVSNRAIGITGTAVEIAARTGSGLGGINLQTYNGNIDLISDGNILMAAEQYLMFLNNVGSFAFGETGVTNFANQQLMTIAKNNSDIADNRMLQFFTGQVVNKGGIRLLANTLVLDSTSSITLKENIRENQQESYDIVKSLRSVRFDWKEVSGGLKDCDGFIAEEVSELYPPAATMIDEIPGVAQSKFIPVLWGALRNTMEKCENLTSLYDDLEAKYNSLEEKYNSLL